MEPTRPADRIRQLDVLRGVALLGILVINVRYFAAPLRRLADPTVAADGLEPANLWAWSLGTWLCEDKMIALFSMLFGAGVVLMGRKGVGRQLLRMLFLFGIGAAHAFGLWFGDILMIYAACGLVLILLQRLPAAALIALGVLALLQPVYSSVEPAIATSLTQVERAPPTGFAQARGQARRRLFSEEAEREAHAAGYVDQARWRAEVIRWRTFAETFDLFRCGGYMLLGMALLKLGFLNGAARRGTYAAVAAAGLLLGGAATALGMWPQLEAILGEGGVPGQARTLGFGLRYLGACGMSLGLAAAVLLACGSKAVQRAAWPLAAVGRMALTNYLTHTLVCVLIYEGWAGGRWGTHDVQQQLLVVASIWAAQLALCPLWLAYFRFGPAEWLWRSLTYLRRQPMRIGSGA